MEEQIRIREFRFYKGSDLDCVMLFLGKALQLVFAREKINRTASQSDTDVC